MNLRNYVLGTNAALKGDVVLESLALLEGIDSTHDKYREMFEYYDAAVCLESIQEILVRNPELNHDQIEMVEIALKRFGLESGDVEISCEGIGSVVKAAWEKVKAFFLSFFKSKGSVIGGGGGGGRSGGSSNNESNPVELYKKTGEVIRKIVEESSSGKYTDVLKSEEITVPMSPLYIGDGKTLATPVDIMANTVGMTLAFCGVQTIIATTYGNYMAAVITAIKDAKSLKELATGMYKAFSKLQMTMLKSFTDTGNTLKLPGGFTITYHKRSQGEACDVIKFSIDKGETNNESEHKVKVCSLTEIQAYPESLAQIKEVIDALPKVKVDELNETMIKSADEYLANSPEDEKEKARRILTIPTVQTIGLENLARGIVECLLHTNNALIHYFKASLKEHEVKK